MSKPLTTGLVHTPAPFSARVLLVRQEVESRIRHTPTPSPCHHRARLWVSWLKRHVLDVQGGAA